MRKSSSIITALLSVMMVAVIVALAVTAINDKSSIKESERVLNEAKELSDEGSKLIDGTVGYLNIPDTKIDYPIMQSDMEYPDFYLNHDIYKSYSKYGTPYLSAYCNVAQDDNLVIYGHNINGVKIFGELMKYKDSEFYKKHKFLYFTTDVKRKYEIISVMSVNKYSFPYYRFIVAQDKEDFDEFVSNAKKNSLYECSATAEYGQQLITLSTCDNNRGHDYRFAVVCVEKSKQKLGGKIK